MQLKKREAERVFRKLRVTEKVSTHHVAGVVRLDGILAVPIYYSRGRGDMPGRVGDRFRRSLYLSVEEFQRLAKCSMSRDQWVALVRSRVR